MVSSEGTCAAFFAAGRGLSATGGVHAGALPLVPVASSAHEALPMTASDEPLVTIDANGVACPAPIPEDQRVILGHGSGGQLSTALMRDVLAPALAAASPGGVLNDAAVVELAGRAPGVHHRLVRRVADPLPGR